MERRGAEHAGLAIGQVRAASHEQSGLLDHPSADAPYGRAGALFARTRDTSALRCVSRRLPAIGPGFRDSSVAQLWISPTGAPALALSGSRLIGDASSPSSSTDAWAASAGVLADQARKQESLDTYLAALAEAASERDSSKHGPVLTPKPRGVDRCERAMFEGGLGRDDGETYD